MIEYLVQNGQQVFVISWRNPDARHAGWGLDTYVEAVLDALDAVQRVCGTDRAALTGVCAGGIIASATAAHLAATGQQDQLSAFSLLVTVLDTARAGTVGALVDRRLASAAKTGSSCPPAATSPGSSTRRAILRPVTRPARTTRPTQRSG
jgi:polyhydroxyalkanoate synthase